MYNILASATVSADDPATALTQGTIGDKQLVYAIFDNASGTAATLTTADATAAQGIPLPTGERWFVGPMLGESLENWGLFAAAPADVTVTLVSGRPRLRVGLQEPADNPEVTTALPFVVQQLS